MTVAAEAEVPVETTVTVRPVDVESLYQTAVALSNTRYFGVMFAHVDRYEVLVETDQHHEVVVVTEDWIDCNESAHVVLLSTDGSVRSTAGGTDMGC